MRWTEAAGALAMAAAAAGGQQSPPVVQHLPQGPVVPVLPAPVNPPGVQPPRFLVVIDAAHGGNDIGARMGNGTLEKDISLGLAGRLRSTLHARGVEVVMTRKADVNLAAVTRAEAANRAQAS